MTCHLTLQGINRAFENFNNNINEAKRIQTVILNALQEENSPTEELQVKRKIVLEKLPLDWPLIPLSKGIFSQEEAKYISHIHSLWCLDSKSDLWQLWVVDIQTHLMTVFNSLGNIKHIGISPKDIEDVGSEFAVAALMLLIFSFQNKLEGTSVTKLVYSMEKFNHNFPRLVDVFKKIEAFKLKTSKFVETAKNQALTIADANYKKQFEELYQNAELLEKHLKYIEWSLNFGLKLWGTPYLRHYFYGIELGYLVAPQDSGQIGLLQENISKINRFINVVRTGWKEAHQKRCLAMIPNMMESLNNLPKVETYTSRRIEDITFYSHALKKGMCELHATYESITLIFFQSQNKEFSWLEVKQRLFEIVPDSPLQLDDKFMSVKKPSEWLSEMVSCFAMADLQLMTIHRMYENVICKNTIPNFASFDELCTRLTTNFKNLFTENLKESCAATACDPLSQDPLDQLVNNFSNDLLEISKQFGAKINEHLPDRDTIDYCIFKFSLLKNSLVSVKTLRPFSSAVIFVATSVLPAIKKAHRWLFKRFDRALKNLDGKTLESEREFLTERLQGLCFIKMKPLLELLITIRDIQAILLDPHECSPEMEKGLHLVPSEFVNLLQPREIAELIGLRIQTINSPQDAFEQSGLAEEEMASILQDMSTGDKNSNHFDTPQIPALQNSIDQKNVVKILNTLSDSRSFKIGKGEKTSKILKRLKELGAYKLREGKGSHIIWAHPDTHETFSYVYGDDLSLGVAKKLEDWVNIDIFKNKK